MGCVSSPPGSASEDLKGSLCTFPMVKFATDSETGPVRGVRTERSGWYVVGTALFPVPALQVVDLQTGNSGLVVEFTTEEWARAFSAPSMPYAWNDLDRVVHPDW